jgi:hypothetical protein
MRFEIYIINNIFIMVESTADLFEKVAQELEALESIFAEDNVIEKPAAQSEKNKD